MADPGSPGWENGIFDWLAGYWMFLDFTIRAFLNCRHPESSIPAEDGIFDQHRSLKSGCISLISINNYAD